MCTSRLGDWRRTPTRGTGRCASRGRVPSAPWTSARAPSRPPRSRARAWGRRYGTRWNRAGPWKRLVMTAPIGVMKLTLRYRVCRTPVSLWTHEPSRERSRVATRQQPKGADDSRDVELLDQLARARAALVEQIARRIVGQQKIVDDL